jgi:hypothetical protein
MRFGEFVGPKVNGSDRKAERVPVSIVAGRTTV